MIRLMILALALLLTACGRDADTPAGDAATPQTSGADAALASDLLTRIDAETAKLWLSLEPLPEALLNQIWSALASVDAQLAEENAALAEEIDDPLLLALWNELSQLRSPADYAERGIDANGLAALHLVSIYPFFHWQLSDPEAFAAMLARIEGEAGTPWTRRSVGDQDLIWIDLDRFGLALHHDANFMTLALVSDRADLIRRVANVDRSNNPIQRSELDRFASQRGLRQDSFGFFDFGRLLSLLLDGEDELLVQLRGDTRLGQVAADAACREELGQLVQLFPRKSYGNTLVSDHSLAMKATLEADPEFALRMSALADSPVSLLGKQAAVMSMGISLNLVAARDFGRQIVGGWVETPPQCLLFSNIRDNAANWLLALNRPIPPVVTNIQGARIHLDALDMEAGESGAISGTFALFMRNPQMLIGMAQIFSSELAALDLRPGAPPQPLPADMLPQLAGLPAWIGLSETGLGLAVGEGQDAELPAALEAGSADSSVLSFSVDMAAYASLMRMSLSNLPGQASAGTDFDPAEADQAAEAMEMLAAFYRSMSNSLHLNESGIELQLQFELAD